MSVKLEKVLNILRFGFFILLFAYLMIILILNISEKYSFVRKKKTNQNYSNNNFTVKNHFDSKEQTPYRSDYDSKIHYK